MVLTRKQPEIQLNTFLACVGPSKHREFYLFTHDLLINPEREKKVSGILSSDLTRTNYFGPSDGSGGTARGPQRRGLCQRGTEETLITSAWENLRQLPVSEN